MNAVHYFRDSGSERKNSSIFKKSKSLVCSVGSKSTHTSYVFSR